MTKTKRRLVKSERELRLLNRSSRNKIVSNHITRLVNKFEKLSLCATQIPNMAEQELARHKAEYETLKAKIDPLMATIETLIGDDEEVRSVKTTKTKVAAYVDKLTEIDRRLENLQNNNPEILSDITKVRDEVFDLGLDGRCCILEAEDFISNKTLGMVPGSFVKQITLI